MLVMPRTKLYNQVYTKSLSKTRCALLTNPDLLLNQLSKAN
jgi:hypothetical protein